VYISGAETCSGYETEKENKKIKTIRNIAAIDGTPKGYRNRYNRMQPSKIKIKIEYTRL
jgi:hypothetical protein